MPNRSLWPVEGGYMEVRAIGANANPIVYDGGNVVFVSSPYVRGASCLPDLSLGSLDVCWSFDLR